jgi:hypothetical protein
MAFFMGKVVYKDALFFVVAATIHQYVKGILRKRGYN